MKLIHYGETKYDPDRVKPIRNQWIKPKGGLWTSPIDSNYGWIDFCDFRPIDKDEYFEVILTDNCRILKIDSFEDFIVLPFMDDKYLDFEEISKEYDVIWLTEKGESETRCEYPKSLYGWDCESVLILNPSVIIPVEREQTKYKLLTA